jgi:hypothetical protein
VGQEITVVTNPDTATMERYLVEAARIISRAGYTTIMELASLGRGAILIPTPGQTEQEYLGRYLNGRLGFVTVSQRDIRPTVPLRHRNTEHAGELLPDAAPLLKKALDMLLEKEEQ